MLNVIVVRLLGVAFVARRCDGLGTMSLQQVEIVHQKEPLHR